MAVNFEAAIPLPRLLEAWIWCFIDIYLNQQSCLPGLDWEEHLRLKDIENMVTEADYEANGQ